MKRCELVYGRSGSGKTTWALALAEAIWKAYGLRTRWYLGDGGYETIEASGLIDDGIVECVQYNLWPYPFETSMRAVQGWWPGDPGKPGSPWQAPPPDLGARYGLFVFEGVSVMCDYMQGDRPGGLRERNARGEKIKEAGISFGDGSSKFGTNSAANYGTVQEHITTRIEESRALPGWVQWTAHETLAEDKKSLGKRGPDGSYSGPTISAGVEYGPDVIGQAMTPVIGASFGNTIHLHPAIATVRKEAIDPVTKKPVEAVEITYRAYTRRHLDPHMSSTVKYFANNRMPPAFSDLMPEYIQPVDPLKFYEILAEGKRLAREARAKVATPSR